MAVFWERPSHLLFATVLLVFLLGQQRVLATDQHWTGTTSTTWGTGGNWNLGLPGGTDNAVFDGTFSNQPSVVVSITAGGIWMTGSVGQNVTIGAGGGTLTLNGNTINGTSGLGILIDNANAFTLTINAPLKVGAAQIWRNNSSNLFTIGGGVNTNAFALTIDGTGNTTVSGIVSGSGTLTKAGSGTLTLSGTNTYSGATTISAGVLNIQNNSALGTNAGGTTVSSGAALQIQNSIAVGAEALTLNGSGISNDGALRNISGTNSMSGAITLGSASTIGSDAGTLTLSGSITNGGFLLTTIGAGNITLSGAIGGTGGLTMSGTGTLTLSHANTYTGTTTVNSGTLALSNATAASAVLVVGDNTQAAGYATVQNLAANELSNTTAVTINPSGVWNLNGFADTINGTLTLESGDTAGASITNSGAAKLTLKSDVTLNVMGTGAVGATISGNIIDGGAIRTFTVNDGTADADLTISAVLQGAKGYIKTGAGRLVLSGANTNAGTFTINGGPVQLQNAAAISSFSGTTVNSGGALEFTGGITYTLGGGVTINGSGVSSTGALLNVSGTNSYADAITLGSASKIASAAGTLTLSGNVANGGFLLTMGGASSLIASGAISGTGGLTKVDAGTTKLSGTNTYSGVTTVSAGTLQFAKQVSLYNNNTANWTATNIVVQSGATAAFNVGGAGEFTSANIDTLKALGTGTGGFESGSFLGLDTTNAGGSFTYGSAIANTNSGTNVLGLTKLGTGTLVVNGASTYTGATNVNAGTLSIDNNNTTTARLAGTSSVIVNSGGTLLLAQGGVTASTDRINNSAGVTINGGGTVNTAGLTEGTRPTNSGSNNGVAGMGALTLQNTSLGARATIDFGSGTGSSLVFSGLSGASAAFVSILHWTGTTQTDNSATTNDRLLFATNPNLTNADLANWQFYDDAGSAFATGAMEIVYGNLWEIVPIPEPATYLSGILTVGALLWIQRRRLIRA